MKKNYVIIYHNEDNDGLFSMAIAYNFLIHEKNINANDIDLFGATYVTMGELDLNDIINNYENVIMTDISFSNRQKMINLASYISGEFTWIDHHAPIINDSKINHWDNIYGLRDINNSALYNMYKYLYDPFEEHIPEYFKILSAWDSFSFERLGYNIDYVKNVNVGTNITYNLNAESIIKFVYDIIYVHKHNKVFPEIHLSGKLINKAKDIENENLIKMYGDTTWTVNGRQACAIFTQEHTNSLVFKCIKDKIKHGIVFKRNTNGTWTISLYNTDTAYDNEFDCGLYLKENYNGGGHKGAAGCQVKETKFIKILKYKKL